MAAAVVRHPAEELPAKRRRALELLVAGGRPSDVATELGINRKTLYTWRQSPEFNEAFEAMQLDLQDEVQAVLVGRAADIAAALGDLALDPGQPGMARVHAARVYFELLGWHKGSPVKRPERRQDVETEEDLLELLRGVPPRLLRRALGDDVVDAEDDEGG